MKMLLLGVLLAVLLIVTLAWTIPNLVAMLMFAAVLLAAVVALASCMVLFVFCHNAIKALRAGFNDDHP